MGCLNSKAKSFKVGNGTSVNILFIFPIITIQGHMFEICTEVSEVNGNVDFVLGVKNSTNFEAE